MSFTTSITVRFGDLDPAGVAYYPRLAHYLHVAFEDFFAHGLRRPYAELVASGRGFPTVKLEMEFGSPVRLGDPLSVEVAVERVGRTSVHVRYVGRVGAREAFRARNVAVCIDMKTFQPVPIPDELRSALQSAS